jgi:hypothetical protein
MAIEPAFNEMMIGMKLIGFLLCRPGAATSWRNAKLSSAGFTPRAIDQRASRFE